MNAKGGGISHVSEFRSDELRVFRGGLRHLPQYSENQMHGSKLHLSNYHDKMSYERGFIQHSRSTSNQYFFFHYMYGGAKKYFIDRTLVQTWYRKNIRNWWFPVVTSYTAGCFFMRLYDNAAHDYFYFTN